MTQSSNELQAELDQIIEWFESDDFDIDEAANKYQRSQEIINELNKRLKETKNKISKLKVDLD